MNTRITGLLEKNPILILDRNRFDDRKYASILKLRFITCAPCIQTAKIKILLYLNPNKKI